MPEETVGKRLAVRARELATVGVGSVDELPTTEAMARLGAKERHALLEGLRVELYAISSILADGVLTRARRRRAMAPPYGLVRSRYTELRMLIADPAPFAAGSIGDFHALGLAYIDTTVFHLHAYIDEVKATDQRWLFERLEDLLRLFCVGASPALRARMRDGISFLYGGLHFGTAITVQVTEAMAALLGDTDLSPDEKRDVLARSGLPVLHLAALGFSEVISSVQGLMTTGRPTTGATKQVWMDPSRFVLKQSEGRPWRIDLREEDGAAAAASVDTFSSQGCPARISPTGSVSPITTLWTWCAELAHTTGLLG